MTPYLWIILYVIGGQMPVQQQPNPSTPAQPIVTANLGIPYVGNASSRPFVGPVAPGSGKARVQPRPSRYLP